MRCLTINLFCFLLKKIKKTLLFNFRIMCIWMKMKCWRYNMNKFRSLVKPFCHFVTILSIGIIFCTQMKKEKNVRTVANLPIKVSNAYYTGNRSPLMPNPLIKMPTGSVQPQGWLLKQLELMRDGFVGHMPEISRFLKQKRGWLSLRGDGWGER